MLSSTLNLFLLFIYWALGRGFIRPANMSENKIVRVLAKVGFGGNIALFIFSERVYYYGSFNFCSSVVIYDRAIRIRGSNLSLLH